MEWKPIDTWIFSLAIPNMNLYNYKVTGLIVITAGFNSVEQADTHMLQCSVRKQDHTSL